MTTTTPTAAELSRLALAETEAMHAEALTLTDDRQAAAEELRTYLTSGQASLSELSAYADQWNRALAAEKVAVHFLISRFHTPRARPAAHRP